MSDPDPLPNLQRLFLACEVDGWEVYFERREIAEAQVTRSIGARIRRGLISCAAVRVIKSGCPGFAYTNNTDETALIRCIEQSIRSAESNVSGEPPPVFCPPVEIGDYQKYFDISFESSDFREPLGLFTDHDDYAFQSQSGGLSCVERTRREETIFKQLVNSYGAFLTAKETLFTLTGKWLYSSDQGQLLYEDASSSHFNSCLYPGWNNQLKYFAESRSNNHPDQTKTGITDLILSPAAGRAVLFLLFPLFQGESAYAKIMNSQIHKLQSTANCPISLIDNRTLHEGPGSCLFDGEGYPGRKNIILNNGWFANPLCDSVTAGQFSSGNAERDEQLRPFLAPGNLFIQNGNMDDEDLLRNTHNGIWIYKLLNPLLNSLTGRFAFGFEGLRIINGEIGSPCAGLTGEMTLMDFFTHLSGIGDDLVINQRVSSPTLKLSDMPISVI